MLSYHYIVTTFFNIPVTNVSLIVVDIYNGE